MAKKIRIRSLGRVISGLDDFGLYGVAGMVIEGSLTVFWSTGRDATTTLEYGFDDSDPATFQSITISGLREHHTVEFPQTFIDTDHYFRVRSTDPTTGEEKVSDVFRVFVPKRLLLSSEVGTTGLGQFLDLTIIDHTFPVTHNLDVTVLKTQIPPDVSSEILIDYGTISPITVPEHTVARKWTIVTNIKTASVA